MMRHRISRDRASEPRSASLLARRGQHVVTKAGDRSAHHEVEVLWVDGSIRADCRTPRRDIHYRIRHPIELREAALDARRAAGAGHPPHGEVDGSHRSVSSSHIAIVNLLVDCNVKPENLAPVGVIAVGRVERLRTPRQRRKFTLGGEQALDLAIDVLEVPLD